MDDKNIYFVSGIDTDAGKSVVTGLLARRWCDEGRRVITQKFVQTGNRSMSEDIELHRRLMGIPLQPEDLDGTTCPLIFTYPSSPQLAARLDGREIDLSQVDRSSRILSERYEVVLLEGAGGLFVPLTDTYSTIDYIAERKLPLILVTTSRLGSINHTVLSLEACRARGIEVAMLAYNLYPVTDTPIVEDTRRYLQQYMNRYHPTAQWLEIDENKQIISLSAVVRTTSGK